MRELLPHELNMIGGAGLPTCYPPPPPPPSQTGLGVKTATLAGGVPPPVYSVVNNKAGIVVGVGTDTAFSAQT